MQGRFWFGHSGDEIADEVVLGVERIAPLPLLTIHCHGGREVVTMLLEAFRNQGCSVCDWREFLSQTETDPIRRLAAEALTRAPTMRTAAILLDQYNGAFTNATKEIRKNVEADDQAAALTLLADLVCWTSLGRHLTTPWRSHDRGAAERREKQPGQCFGGLSAFRHRADAGNDSRCRHCSHGS